VRIDRIDRLEDGREVHHRLQDRFAERAQLGHRAPGGAAVAALLHDARAPLAGVLFAKVKAGQCRFVGLVDEGIAIPGAESTDLRARVDAWRVVLAALAASFRAGHAGDGSHRPGEQLPLLHSRALCRVAEADN